MDPKHMIRLVSGDSVRRVVFDRKFEDGLKRGSVRVAGQVVPVEFRGGEWRQTPAGNS